MSTESRFSALQGTAARLFWDALVPAMQREGFMVNDALTPQGKIYSLVRPGAARAVLGKVDWRGAEVKAFLAALRAFELDPGEDLFQRFRVNQLRADIRSVQGMAVVTMGSILGVDLDKMFDHGREAALDRLIVTLEGFLMLR